MQKQQILEKHPELDPTNTVITPKVEMITKPATNAAKTNAPKVADTNPAPAKIPGPPNK